MKRIFLAICMTLALSVNVWGQKDKKETTLPLEEDPIEELLDSMMVQYEYDVSATSVYDTLLLNTQNFRSNAIPTYSEAVIKNRLNEIPSIVSLDHNKYVQGYINMYTQRRRDLVSKMLGLEKVYFPIFEQELDRMGMPMELKYLAIVESALNPHARSRVGATGLWQFMYGTAKQYGLKVNSFVDERKDPYKSTVAAVKYLKNAHDMFGDWLLAIASYNCGPGNVRKAIARSGGKRNFWAIRPYLPRETSGYVPAFISAVYTFQYASEHNIYPVYVDFSLNQDTLHISHMDISLKEIADMTGASLTELRNMNPELKLQRVPYTNEPYVLRVPKKVAIYFAENQDRITQTYGQPKNRKKDDDIIYTNLSPYEKPSGKLQYYTVKSGDVVGGIADKFGVSARQVAYWNDLRRYRIRVGQRLRIYSNNKPKVTKAAAPKVTSLTTAPTPPPSNGKAIYHKIGKGETLWNISKQYPGTSISSIQSLNPGLNASNLKIGQQVRVK